MALPVTITGIALDVAAVGPYESSAGNHYFFGKDSSDVTVMRCMKATDPTDAWTSIATSGGFAAAGIMDIAGFQKNDIVHLAIADTYSGEAGYNYRAFNMATETFDIAEAIIDSLSASNLLCSIVVRSDGTPVVLFKAASYQIHYSIRTGTNTWSAAVEVDDGGGDQYNYPVAILGNADAVHFVYWSSSFTNQKTLTSSNVLQSVITAPTTWFSEGISLNYGGATRCLAAGSATAEVLYFDSGDSPTLNLAYLGSINPATIRLFVRNNMVYALYSKTSGGNKDYYFKVSDDGGAHWAGETFICSATNNASPSSTSRFSRLFPSLTDIFLPFVYADSASTELKYNHKKVATTILQGQASFLGGGFFVPTAIGGDFSAPLEDPFRLRFSIVNEGDSLTAAPWQLYVSKNGGAYHAVTTSSDDARSVNAGSSPDETQIFIPRLTIPV